MAAILHRTKTWIYIFAASTAIILLAVRAFNALQKNIYSTQSIQGFQSGTETSLSYPNRILSPKTNTLFPLTITFINKNHPQAAYDYEFVFESPTLVFTDVTGKDLDPRIKISSDYGSIQKTIYIRPSPSENYLKTHALQIRVFQDNQELTTTPASVAIQVESRLLSFLTLTASSILEISVVLGLATLVTKALDDEQKARMELTEQRRGEIQKLASLPTLSRMKLYRELEDKQYKELWEDELKNELVTKKSLFSERDFFQALGPGFQPEARENLRDISALYSQFFRDEENSQVHQDAVDTLYRIMISGLNEPPLLALDCVMKLRDDFDADINELLVAFASQLSRQPGFKQISREALDQKIFYNYDRRRLLRSLEFRNFFPLLDPPPPAYKAVWHNKTTVDENPCVLKWLRQHGMDSNPFGPHGIHVMGNYPVGSARPDNWEAFMAPWPTFGRCPSSEDVEPVGLLMREECLPPKKNNHAITKADRRIFPICVFLNREDILHEPLVTICYSAAQSWMDLLPLSPDVCLDLPMAEQNNLLELLVWCMGSNKAVINSIQRIGWSNNAAGNLLKRRITDFVGSYSPSHKPLDDVLLSWLRIRPPDLEKTYLILIYNHLSRSSSAWWIDQFFPFQSHLYLNGVIPKFISSAHAPSFLGLQETSLYWSDGQLMLSLDGQFDAAMDQEEKEEMGVAVRFHDFFGPGAAKELSYALIKSSQNSLGKLLTLGHQLLQMHCAKDGPTKYLFPEELENMPGKT